MVLCGGYGQIEQNKVCIRTKENILPRSAVTMDSEHNY
jgi:hypothetical protein